MYEDQMHFIVFILCTMETLFHTWRFNRTQCLFKLGFQKSTRTHFNKIERISYVAIVWLYCGISYCSRPMVQGGWKIHMHLTVSKFKSIEQRKTALSIFSTALAIACNRKYMKQKQRLETTNYIHRRENHIPKARNLGCPTWPVVPSLVSAPQVWIFGCYDAFVAQW